MYYSCIEFVVYMHSEVGDKINKYSVHFKYSIVCIFRIISNSNWSLIILSEFLLEEKRNKVSISKRIIFIKK